MRFLILFTLSLACAETPDNGSVFTDAELSGAQPSRTHGHDDSSSWALLSTEQLHDPLRWTDPIVATRSTVYMHESVLGSKCLTHPLFEHCPASTALPIQDSLLTLELILFGEKLKADIAERLAELPPEEREQWLKHLE